MFKGRQLLIATMHKKEQVIAPILEKEIGVLTFVVNNFDTDSFGTFSGEVKRLEDPISTLRKKCLKAMELNQFDMAIASEGSFGPHPTFFWVPADDELLIFIDKKNEIEIIVRDISTDTNFSGKEIKSIDELNQFAELAKFPSHGLILRKDQNDSSDIKKGITDPNILQEVFNSFIVKYGSAFVETDMRAMYNPSRMKVIETASIKLAERLKSLCPVCKFPGFGTTDIKQGLPCEECNLPTKSTLSYLKTCQKCKYTFEQKYPHGKIKENPMYCDYCNP